MRRAFSRRQRKILQLVSGNQCAICGTHLKDFHADHKRPFSKGGDTLITNGQALCASCNLRKGDRMAEIQLRPWQSDATKKALGWLLGEDGGKHFLINAAPGSGKTICASVIAQKLIGHGSIERVIVIAPRKEVVRQWCDDFAKVTGRTMLKVTGADADMEGYGADLCATWAAIEGLLEGFQEVCDSTNTLVICDEHHHAAIEAAWGRGADGAFANAKHVIVLTGTPIRSDGQEPVWFAYDDAGQIDHPKDGTYTLTYGDAVDLGYCRPITFHRHEGNFSVTLPDGEAISVSGANDAELEGRLKNLQGLQQALEFYRLACTPKYTDKGRPDPDSYQGSMLEWAIAQLEDLRCDVPNAGGLVIAPSIEIAEYMAELIEILDDEKPILIHSQMANADQKIKAFRQNRKKWIVSVAMISEGVDIKRLRVLVYLPNSQTELSFRQAMGRVVRTLGPDDYSRAYVVMPTHRTFEQYARRVEQEMSPDQRDQRQTRSHKLCPICEEQCERSAKECPSCGYEFPGGQPRYKTCDQCDKQNPVNVEQCQFCGHSFKHDFEVNLNEALRVGAIVRGMDLDEEEVVEGEKYKRNISNDILRSGDENLIRLMQTIPPESWGRLKKLLDDNE